MLESPNNLGPRVRYRARRSAPWTSSVGTVCSPCTENPEWTHLTHDHAQLLALSGPRNPYPGKLGVVEVEAFADLLLVNGDPIANIDLVADPERNFVVIMKDGKIYKNSL